MNKIKFVENILTHYLNDLYGMWVSEHIADAREQTIKLKSVIDR